MRIRSAAADDAPALADLHARVLAHHPAPELSLTLLAEAAHTLVGYLVGTTHGLYTGPGAPDTAPPHGYIQQIAVDPEQRFRGVGRILIEGFLERGRAVGARWVFTALDEGAGVEGRLAFFRATGFVPVDDPEEEHPVMGQRT